MRGHRSCWLCQCSCGKQKIVTAHGLLSGSTKGCGHLRGGHRKIDLASQRFGYLVVLEDAGRTRAGQMKWLCQCDCGKTRVVTSGSLRSRHTTSCGCRQREVVIIRNTTHGLSKTPEYRLACTNKRKEKKQKLDTAWTTDMEIALAAYFPTCVVCGSTGRLATDHAMPLASGHGLRPGNAVKLCKSCNSRKSYKNLDSLSPNMRDKIVSAAQNFKQYWDSQYAIKENLHNERS